MKYGIIASLLLITSAFLLAGEPARERIEWIDIWITDADKEELPRVLLVGDSITRGYFGGVENQLAGKAYCARLTTSKCVSDPTFNDDLLVLLKQYKFAAIHFNNGLHGWGFTEDQYRDGLKETLTLLKENSQGAKIIWTTTTPMRDTADLSKMQEMTARVIERNRLADELTKGQEIVTDDLFELVKDHPEWQSPDGVHFNGQGNEAMARQVADSVLKVLP
ncbi:SGNH/GDSL hydrolase family protein [Planctomicrobium sp. SH661]|uniref:SGNH/GDSL hydrolase family protein n=1 Tax=Planctomicrobium sp. SH661 TaxID=3448124 RepID=UPI003F5C0996